MEGVKSPASRPSRRVYLLVTLFAFALVLLPFLFWYDTWFGRRLTDDKIGQYLNEAQKPRHAQHALVQIGERLGRGDESVRRWYPRIVELASSPSEELRQTAAWIMGQDTRYAEFHPALVKLLHDSSPLVRRNAALSLSGFRDPAARPELHAMLRPATIVSLAAGAVKFRLQIGEYVNRGTLVARVGETEVRSDLPGEVRQLFEPEGGEVAAGQALVELSPDQSHAWEALRALYLVGDREDLEDVERYARGVPGMPPKIQQQAARTLHEIQNRSR